MTGDTGSHHTLEPAPVWLRLASTGLHLLAAGGVMTLASVVLEPVLPSQERRTEWLERWEPWRKRWYHTTLWSRIKRHRDGGWLDGTVGLRVVDARTGGPMTLSSAIREEAFDVALLWLGRQVWVPRFERFQRQIENGEPGDNSPLSGCLLALAIQTAPVLSVPFNPRRQSLRQMAAGVMVVRSER